MFYRTGLQCVERITQLIGQGVQRLIFLAWLWKQRLAAPVATSKQNVHFVLCICWIVATWDKFPLCFYVTLLFLYPAGGPAEGNSDQLPVFGGLFHTGFIKSIAELIKCCAPMKEERAVEVERMASRGQFPRQEEGIPSPSLQSHQGVDLGNTPACSSAKES